MSSTDSEFYVTMMANITENIRTYSDIEKKARESGDVTKADLYKEKLSAMIDKKDFILRQWNLFEAK